MYAVEYFSTTVLLPLLDAFAFPLALGAGTKESPPNGMAALGHLNCTIHAAMRMTTTT